MLIRNVNSVFKRRLAIPHTTAIRHVSLVTDKIEPASESDVIPWSNAKPYAQVPVYPFWDWSKRVAKDKKAKDLRLGEIINAAFVRTNSEIFKLKVPFLGDQLFIKNPDDVQSLLQNDGKYPYETAFEFFEYYRTKKRPDLFGKCPGLLGTNGEHWAEIRTAVNQDLMRPSSASYYLDDLIDVTQDFLNLIMTKADSDSIIDDLTPYMYRFAMEAVTVVFLDSRLGCLSEPPNPQAQILMDNLNIVVGETLVELLFGLPFWKVIPTKSYKNYDTASEIVHKISADLINIGQKKHLEQEGKRKSMLGKLIERCGPDSLIPLAMAQDALFAGMDTTGNSSAFLLYLVASNPDKQELLYKEIIEKVPIGEKLTVPLLMEMKYVKGAMNESHRMVPVVQGLGRKTQKDMVLSGYQIPNGTRVNYNNKFTGRNKEYFPQAEKFLPERWIRGHSESKKRHPFALIPFSHGSRMCVGRRVAEMEIQVLLVETLRRFKLEFHGSKSIDIGGGLISAPDNPLTIKFIPRD